MTTTDPRAYVRIADDIRERIENGTLGPGDRVSITALCSRYPRPVARQTAAKALRLLESEGLIRRWPGLGYIVLSQSPD